jgi:myo-inositol-1(or 4)-monophosphatase
MHLLETAVEIAREAGRLVANYHRRHIPFEIKGEFDLVTEADRASEKLIVERLRSEYRWFVDPLDGTTNFAHGFPMFCISMGLERAGELIAGVVYDPVRDELFTAERGAGAFLNNHRIRASAVARVSESLASTGFPSRKRHHNINIHFYYQLAMASHGVRRTGSAALDLAFVAAGRLDFFWEFGLKPWDIAAGALLVQEAGGRVSEMTGGPLSVTASDHLLADNGLLHDEILAAFAEIFQGRLRVPLPAI